ncbi:phospholipase [Deinococcus sp. HMF7620]|uniref:Phospholipase n=1 Tax=Deinococcus arboris TaxID=2682977 RepID=A0A7C9HU66_9DEIO|nr:phospholipase A2 [Deinococcus arboris]MVN89133.1 phospholipase [Deinococcus arboris]
MKQIASGLLLTGTLTLVACGQTSPAQHSGAELAGELTVGAQIAEYAKRPELQDATSQHILREQATDPILLLSLQQAYGDQPKSELGIETAAIPSHTLTAQNARLNYVKRVAWNSPSAYRAERARPSYAGLDWSNDGCSAPVNYLGYNDVFHAACEVHDFGYRNLPRLTPRSEWDGLRGATDAVFLANMKVLCDGLSAWRTPGCYAVASAYFAAVRARGGNYWG